jgi:hypothetical protein
MRVEITWRNERGEIVHVGTHSAIDVPAAYLKANRQMFALRFNPFHCTWSFKILEEKVAVKNKPAIIESSVQKSFWWMDDKEEF